MLDRSPIPSTPAASRCDGCDQTDIPVHVFLAKFIAAAAQAVRYCADCAGLAEANFNGATEWVRPLPLAECSNERWEMIGAGRVDQEGRATVEGLWYQAVDHAGSETFGIVIAGPYQLPPRVLDRAGDDDRLYVQAIADAVGRVGHPRAGEIAGAIAKQATVAAQLGRSGLAYRLQDLAQEVMGRALYYDLHPRLSRSITAVVELAPPRA